MTCYLPYDELAAFASDDLDSDRRAEVARHVESCDRCQNRLAALGRADAVLGRLPSAEPSTAAILATRRAVAEVTQGIAVPEIMTLEEAAAFLRITLEELGEMVEQLPAFELAGQVRVRRTRLIEWVGQRERDYTREAAASWVARGVSSEIEKGVA